MCRTRQLLAAWGLVGCGLALCSCKREARTFHPSPPFAEKVAFREDYADSAYAVAEGKRLYHAFNCNGCHAEGGGGMGPALMDEEWLYGYQPEQIFTTITDGRPNGMPSFRGKIPSYQIWQLVAYVRSLGGLGRKDAAPGRSDHMKSTPPENSRDPETPVESPPPPPGEAAP